MADGAQLKFHFPIKPSFNPILMMLFRRNSKDIRDLTIFLPQQIMRTRQLIILVSDYYSTFILKKSGIDLIWSIVNEIMKNYFWSICSWAGTFFQLSVCPSLFVCLFFLSAILFLFISLCQCLSSWFSEDKKIISFNCCNRCSDLNATSDEVKNGSLQNIFVGNTKCKKKIVEHFLLALQNCTDEKFSLLWNLILISFENVIIDWFLQHEHFKMKTFLPAGY